MMSLPLEFIDPHWFKGTVPLWVGVALLYCLLSTYLRALSPYAYPTWAWVTPFLIGAAIFLILNRGRWFVDESIFYIAIEYFAIAVLALGAVVFWLLAEGYAEYAEYPDTRPE